MLSATLPSDDESEKVTTSPGGVKTKYRLLAFGAGAVWPALISACTIASIVVESCREIGWITTFWISGPDPYVRLSPDVNCPAPPAESAAGLALGTGSKGMCACDSESRRRSSRGSPLSPSEDGPPPESLCS